MKFFLRLGAMAMVAVSLLVAIGSVRHLVRERQQRAHEVQASMASYSAGSQTLNGPLLVFPYQVSVQTWSGKGKPGSGAGSWSEQRLEQRSLVLAPKTLKVDGQLQTETLKRGIFEARIFSGPLLLSGQFELPAINPALLAASSADGQRLELQWGQPQLVLGLGDTRGIRALAGKLGEAPLRFDSGTGVAWQAQGVHALAPQWAADAVLAGSGTVDFDLRLELAGSEGLQIEPTAGQTHIQLRSNWQHPSFVGSMAPSAREVSANGFATQWAINQLATGAAQVRCKEATTTLPRVGNSALLLQGPGEGCQRVPAAMVGVNLIDPVDHYALSERTLKYAELFLLVVCAAVFVMEVVRQVSVHPIQYALVGAALALFFLLVLALGEHVVFWQAYWGASGACAALLAYYASYVLRGWRAGALFGALVLGLLGVLFAILQSESAALLLGSGALFVLLATIMVLTRHVDWSMLDAQLQRPAPGRPQPQMAGVAST